MLDQVRLNPSAQAERLPFRLRRRVEERVELLGGVMDLVKAAEVFHFVSGRLAARRKTIIANHNLHSLCLQQKNPALRAFFEMADLVEVDSIPLIAWARLFGRQSRRFHRCTYLDWRDEFWAMAHAKGWRVFFVGSKPGVAELAAERISAEWPGICLESHHGYFDTAPGSVENAALIRQIGAFAPDVLIVGMGMPLQETWVLQNHDALPTCAIFTVGGAFDYEAGVQIACPRWIGQLGLEWLFRLSTNPKLFRRYVIEPWGLIGPASRDVLRALRSSDRRAEEAPGAVYSRSGLN